MSLQPSDLCLHKHTQATAFSCDPLAPCLSTSISTMPKASKLKIIRSKIKSKDVISTARSITQLIETVGDITSIPALSLSAKLLGSILKDVEKVESNKDACLRLAERVTRILEYLKQRVDGRPDSVPQPLLDDIRHFEM